MNDTLLCSGSFRDLTQLGTTPLPWTHVAPRGEVPGTLEIPAGYNVPGYGKAAEDMEVEGVTVFDDQTLESMVKQFGNAVLIDADHLSYDKEQSTEALGWGQKLRYQADRNGLEMETEWTPPGREKITGKIYRYISPVFAGAVRFEAGTFKFYPSALTGAGLTNRPKLQLRPVSTNREASRIQSPAPDDEAQLMALVARIKNREKCNFEKAWLIGKDENPELFHQADAAAKETQCMALVARIKNREKCNFETAWFRARVEKPELF